MLLIILANNMVSNQAHHLDNTQLCRFVLTMQFYSQGSFLCNAQHYLTAYCLVERSAAFMLIRFNNEILFRGSLP